jgi:hypothetical protein
VPGHRKAAFPPSNSGHNNSLTEGRKAVTCYSTGSTRRPASPRCTKAQHSSSKTWKDILQALKESISRPRLVYPANLPFLIEREIKTFHNKENLKKFMTTKPALQKILKGLLHIKEETREKQEDSRKNKLFTKHTSKQGIGKSKQQGNENDWKQAPLNIYTECKWPQCPNQKT